ncbi:MAG TPA: hypothetical protein GX510_09590 [Firmicutes bacterium]|nr:hypothetical protein [Candidatus Fermentithermobacillaceae bacterium]
MFGPDGYQRLYERIQYAITGDAHLLVQLREEVRPLKNYVRPIHPRSTTSVSLVATDGGSNRVQFDPFLVQIVRVVDSSENEHFLDVVTPSTDIIELSKKQFSDFGPATPLGYMMDLLHVRTLPELSHMIRVTEKGQPVSPSWIQVYRELVEWSVLLKLVREKDFGSDTLIVWDGLLRSKVFAKSLFRRYRELLLEGIERQLRDKKRRIFIVGVAKHSKVLDRYSLALALEDVLTNSFPCYIEVPRELEEKAYTWSEYARGDDRTLEGITELNNMVAGKMFLVKFGRHPRDRIWPVDVLIEQVDQAQTILGYLLADAENGFPIPLYPRSLQKAHESAAMVDFDFEVLEDYIHRSIRELVGNRKDVVDILRLQTTNWAKERYQS